MYPIIKTVQGALLVSELILQTLRILKSNDTKIGKTEKLVSLGLPRNDVGGLISFAESNLTPRAIAGMSEITQRVLRIAQLASGETLSDAQRKSMLQVGFGTFIPQIVNSLAFVHQSEYYNMNTTQKNQLAGEIASIFDGMWDSIPSASQTRLLGVLGLNASSITSTPRVGTQTPGPGSGSTNITPSNQLPPGFKTLQEYLDYLAIVSKNSGTYSIPKSPTSSTGSKPPSSTSGSSGSGSGAGSGGGSSGAGSAGGSSSGGKSGGAGVGSSSSGSGSGSSGSGSQTAKPPSFEGLPEGWTMDPDTGTPLSPEDQVYWKKQGWFINSDGDWEKSTGFYDPEADSFMTEAELNSWRSQGWVLNANGDWEFTPDVADVIIDPDTGSEMSKDEYDAWAAQGWSIKDGSWVFDSSTVGESTIDVNTGEPITVDEITTSAGNGWYIDTDGSWKYDPDLESSSDGYVTDPETGQSMSLQEYQSWNDQGWFLGDDGQWTTNITPEPPCDEDGDEISCWVDPETGQPITDGVIDYWEQQGYTYDPVDQEFAPMDYVDQSTTPPAIEPEDRWYETDDDSLYYSEAPVDEPWYDRAPRRLHDAQCLCDSCLQDATIFDRLSDSPVGRIHESSWFTVDMIDGLPGEFGEVIVGTDVRPFPVSINRNVALPRMEASLVHELMHVAEQLYKTNMTHEQLHAFSLFVYSEVVPALMALRNYQETFQD